MELRNRMIADRPRIEVAVEESSQEESVSSTAPQVGSPISTRTRRYVKKAANSQMIDY